MLALRLITDLVTAARYYFEIRARTADYDLTLRIEQDTREIETAITALRDRGDPAAQLLADQLRHRLARAQGIALAVSAARPPPLGGAGSADEGRPLPPPHG